MGTIWIHSGVGLAAFFVTLLVALAGNVWLVALERAGVAFLVFFLAAFPIRWVLAQVSQTSAVSAATEGEAALEQGGEESFSPLSISQIEKIRPIEDPATVAEVVRRLTDE